MLSGASGQENIRRTGFLIEQLKILTHLMIAMCYTIEVGIFHDGKAGPVLYREVVWRRGKYSKPLAPYCAVLILIDLVECL